ncbi:MAG: ATP-binding protein, partial [Candidatus Tectomicrobia bacterium]|nr:ATP-binding protein [Candidatus Tectomicrobia bacterium]
EMNAIQEIPLRIRNLSKNLLYLGQVYADPRDALNEFVSNAADEYVQAGRQGAVIQIYLGRKGDRPWPRVSDRGRGMSRPQLERVATSLCESEKANFREVPEVIGEKGIGILGFASIAEQCDLVSRAEGSDETHCMSLMKGRESCTIRLEETRKRTEAGTDVYLYGISKDNLRILTPQKLSEYFRIRRRSALLRGDYALEIVEGRKTYPVRPETYKGIPFEVPSANTSFGKIRFHLYLWPTPAQGRQVAVIGKGGTTILDSLDELDEFRSPPWNMNQVQGDITFAALEQTTGRKGIVRDPERFAEKSLQRSSRSWKISRCLCGPGWRIPAGNRALVPPSIQKTGCPGGSIQGVLTQQGIPPARLWTRPNSRRPGRDPVPCRPGTPGRLKTIKTTCAASWIRTSGSST